MVDQLKVTGPDHVARAAAIANKVGLSRNKYLQAAIDYLYFRLGDNPKAKPGPLEKWLKQSAGSERVSGESPSNLRGLSGSLFLSEPNEHLLIDAMRETKRLVILTSGFGYFASDSELISMLQNRFNQQLETTIVVSDPDIVPNREKSATLSRLAANLDIPTRKPPSGHSTFQLLAINRMPPYVAILTDKKIFMKPLYATKKPSNYFWIIDRTNNPNDYCFEIEADVHQTALVASDLLGRLS